MLHRYYIENKNKGIITWDHLGCLPDVIISYLQAERMSDPGPVEDDILINKLRPGHELEMKLFAVKVTFQQVKKNNWVNMFLLPNE